jgi:hypothetical protein
MGRNGANLWVWLVFLAIAVTLIAILYFAAPPSR